MNRIALLAAVLLGSTAMPACSNQGGATLIEGTPDVAGSDGNATYDAPATETTGEMRPADAVDVTDISFEPSDFGKPCKDNDDCLSGLCIPHRGELVCSHECVEECPDGFVCSAITSGGPDMFFACVSLAPSLCLPCSTSEDCEPGPGVPAACVVYPGEGSFCATSCTEEILCLEGSFCLDVDVVEGGSDNFCVLTSGPCECTEFAIATGLMTPCQIANEFGTCTGYRVCMADGLTGCDASIPNEEFCNGADDNCDGQVDEGTCDDGNPCTLDECQPNQGCIFEPQEGTECDDEDPCTVAELCLDGLCQGSPVLCNDDNPCTDDLCDTDGGCVFEANQADCDDGDPCSVGDSCKQESCAGTLVDCDCASDADCAALEDDDICNGTLYCDISKLPFQCETVPESIVECPAPEGKNKLCVTAHCDPADGSCSMVPANGGSPCDDGNKCTYGEACSDGSCVGGKPLNCNDGDLCTDDTCQPGIGCATSHNDAPCDDGNICTVNDLCAAGECTAGGALGCDDNNVCTNDICNPLKGCLYTNNSQPCDDLDPCTEQDSCSGSFCLGTVPKDCADDNPCTDDTCIPLAGCSYNNNTNPCDDGNSCTLADKCNGGTCSPGEALNCDDGNDCTDDSCSPEDGCVHSANTAPCDDNNSCTSKDQCLGGKCIGSGDLDCDDDNPCTKDICLANGGCKNENIVAPCSDGDPCTVDDICKAGECQPGIAVDCDDDNVCTADSCNPANGLCLHSPAPGDCDDANPCTMVDQCDGGKCVGTVPPDCDDENVCTADYCDPAGGCVHLLNTAPCDDGNLCTTGDQCALGECTGGPALTCIDNNPCTDDGCGPESGCTFTPNATPCNDDNACTTNDTCKAGWCAGAPASCNDLNPCTADYCDPGVGCIQLPAGGSCDDSNACTSDDVCDEGLCTGGPQVNCNDGNVCTEDACDPDDGCTNNPADGSCDDGNACTVGDSCDGGTCQAGAQPLDCDDSKVCTEDSCDSDQGCLHTNNTAACDDDNQCTVGDVCADGSCTAGPDEPDCSDNDPCSTDTCDPDLGCQHTGGGCLTFSHAFAKGNTTEAACSKWNAFRATLTGNYSKVTIRGTYDMTGVSCTGAKANTICHAIRTKTAGSYSCDGRSWRTGGCGGDIEVNANGNMCGCTGNSYTVRPCIDYPPSNNPNWGGAKTETCNSPAQTLELICQ